MSAIKTAKFVLILSLLLFTFLSGSMPKALPETDASQAIVSAQQKLIECYKKTVEAEKAGANVTELTIRLNEAGDLYSKATFALKNGHYDLAIQLANQSINSLADFADKAAILRDEAIEAQNRDFTFLIFTSVGAIAVICGGLVIWRLLGRRYHTFFLMAIFISALILASPALSRLLVYPRTEFFTEMWILDPNHRAENYPFNISSGQCYNIYLSIANRLGSCAYYMVQVKFRNSTQPLPTSFGPIDERTPSNLPSLYNLTFFVADKQVEERLITFSINYTVDKVLRKISLESMKLNDVTIGLSDYVIKWNSTKNGFYGFLFFELWLHNENSGRFEYHGRFVGLWLNMTSSA